MIDEAGNMYGRLVVLSRSVSHTDRPVWRCLCSCGKITYVEGRVLRRGRAKSCGCRKVEIAAKLNFKHGHRPGGAYLSRTYNSWRSMLRRVRAHPRYIANEITVCERWLRFENFLEDMGERPIDRTLDRFPDTLGNYEPGNCRWATWSEQRNNQVR